MNYIWELAIKAKEQGIDPDEIFFRYGQPFSGYMELSFTDLNETRVLKEVEINPYYRFYSIFKELFEPNVSENKEIIEAVHDMVLHHLIDIDVLMGMNKREYYIQFIIRNMRTGYFGEYIKEKISIFTRQEQKIIANSLLTLHDAGECIYVLKDTVRRIFTNAYIFAVTKEKDEIIFYLRTKETREKAEKIEVLKHLFLPFKCGVEVYWEYIFGVIGVDELMVIDQIVIY